MVRKDRDSYSNFSVRTSLTCHTIIVKNNNNNNVDNAKKFLQKLSVETATEILDSIENMKEYELRSFGY